MPLIKSNGYNIFIGKNALNALLRFLQRRNYSSYFIICDENTLTNCLPELVVACPILSSAHIIELESGEGSKSIEICSHIWQTLVEFNADRNSLIINLGGGVVTDVGGFCASVYKRAIDFINIPTSLLAMADASVGGKNGINFSSLKNCIGTITQPVAVFIHPKFLKSLPHRHYLNGLAEVYKIALVADYNFWKELALQKGMDLTDFLTRSVENKNNIVLQDPYDKARRMILNFGHTIGHAVESKALAEGIDVLHGEAIVIGMIAESHIAFQKKMISKKQLTEITQVLRSVFKLIPLDAAFSELETYIKNDKKTSGSISLFSLVKGLGTCKIKIPVKQAEIKKAISYYNQQV